jgi:tRNA A37 threonylcarbamoyladenosine synthetase subunit TsaC/SUA5/YrdC
MSTYGERMYQAQLLDNRNLAHLNQAAELIAQGEIIAFGFNGIFVFIGDADQAIAARRIAAVKQQPLDKPLALICAPEYLAEFVNLDAPPFRSHAFAHVQQLQREVYGLGVLVPAARTGIPPYLMHNDTILNVWMEYPPHHPGRYLQQQIRKRGLRAFIGSSANLHGEPTYVDPFQIVRVFGDAIPAILDHDLCGVPLKHRQSTTLIDLTGEYPRLLRPGSVPIDELDVHLKRLGMRQLLVEEPVPHP